MLLDSFSCNVMQPILEQNFFWKKNLKQPCLVIIYDDLEVFFGIFMINVQ